MSGETESVEFNQITFESVKAAVTQGLCLQKSGQTVHICCNCSDLLNTLHEELIT